MPTVESRRRRAALVKNRSGVAVTRPEASSSSTSVVEPLPKNPVPPPIAKR